MKMKSRHGEELKHDMYIGDGVYVAHDGFQIWLGLDRETGIIALGPSVFELLLLYVKTLKERIDNETK